MWDQTLEARAAEMRAEQSRVRRGRQWRKVFCESCGGGVRVEGEQKCFQCRKNALDPAPAIARVPVALRARLCIACQDPFEVTPHFHAKQSYCGKTCAAKALSLKNLSPQDWDACRMLADLDYFGPPPLPVSHWPQIMRLAVG